MNDWTTQDADRLYRISDWSDGYFGVGNSGDMIVLPIPEKKDVQINVAEVVQELRERDVQFPVVLRFHDVLRHRVERLNKAFAQAIEDNEYDGVYRGVYPVKVNQMREVVEEIVDVGMPYSYGLEAGSKAELMAVLSFKTADDSLTICNGYKDDEFLRLALLGNKVGRNVIVVIEKFSEIAPLLSLANEMNVRPQIGLRVKMRVKTEGRWSSSSGEKAKFGLTISEVLQAVDTISEKGFADCIRLLHFHVGSQLSDSSYVHSAVEEGARIYSRLVKRGVALKYLDIGGGLAIDYDGSGTNRHTSMNYTIEEYAANVVASVKQVCELEKVATPNLVTESGRAITAHHSCVIMRVVGEISPQGIARQIPVAREDEHYLISNLRALMEHLEEQENYHETHSLVQSTFEDVLSAFKLGVVRLEELATAENIYWEIMRKVDQANIDDINASEDVAGLKDNLATQYLCNFSLFQSAADSWAIEQLLPVAPISKLDQRPTRNCMLADVTCDSDGKINRFVVEDGEQPTLPLHALSNDEPYFIGLFLTGAYQDVMGDMHNLFGRLHEAHIFCDDDDPSDFYIEEFVEGSSASRVLQIMQYNPEGMAAAIKKEVDRTVREGHIKSREGVQLVDFYEKCLDGYTYLKTRDMRL